MLSSFYLWGFRVVLMQSGEVRRIRTTKASSTRRKGRRLRELRREEKWKRHWAAVIPGRSRPSMCRVLRVPHVSCVPQSSSCWVQLTVVLHVRNVQLWELWGTHFRPVGRVCVCLSYFVLYSLFSLLFCFPILSIFMIILSDFVH